MRKSIAIFGGSLFQDIKYEKDSFIPTPMQTVIKLSKEYKIDNYSCSCLKMERVNRLIHALPMKESYSDCILAVGEADLDNPLGFKRELLEAIHFLEENEILPVLVSLPKELMSNKGAKSIQEILDNIAIAKNIDYIYEGKTSKQVSYMVLENKDWTKAILNLC